MIPSTWGELLANAPADEREPLGLAFQQWVEHHLVAGTFTSQTEVTAVEILSRLAHGTPGSATLLRGWTTGRAADRARAANAVKNYWYEPIWQDLVPQLLDAGLDEQTPLSYAKVCCPSTRPSTLME